MPPRALATSMMARPMGPQPRTSTYSAAEMAPRRHTWTPMAIGSTKEAAAKESPGGTRWTWVAGAVTRSPKPPGWVTPMMRRLAQQLDFPTLHG